MAATGFTSLKLYNSSTPGQVPLAANLQVGELAINIADGILFYKNTSGAVAQFSSSAGSVTSISFGSTGLTPSTSSTGAVTVAGTLAVGSGGTNLTSYTAGDVIYASGTTTLSKLALGTNGYVMTAGASAPGWTAQSALSVGSATTATNVAGGATNKILYQSSAGATAFIDVPTDGTFLKYTTAGGFSWTSAVGGGSVTSVAVSGGTTGLTTSGGPITTSGTITLAGTLVTSNGGTGLTTYTAGDILYYASGTALSKLGIGSANYVLTSSGTAPQYVAQSTLSVGSAGTATTATNIAGGAAGSLPYNTGSGATSFLSLGTANYVLTAGASAPQYVAQSTLSVGSATSATTATNIAAGASGSLPYQSGAATTTFLSLGTQNYLLRAGASAPEYASLSSVLDGLTSTQGSILYRGASSWAALGPGTSGYILSTAGSGANPSWIANTAGVTGFSGALNTAAPNATNNVSSLTASGGTAIQYAALVPKSTGGVLAAVPDSTATGGNVRGATSVDWQTNRSAAAMVASGTNSVIGGGQDNTASGSGSVVAGGYTQSVTSSYGASLGGAFGSVTGNYSSNLGGLYSTDRGVYGTVANAGAYSYGGTTYGALLRTSRLLGASTTDATTTVVSTTGAAASATNQVVLANNSALYFIARIVGTVTNGGDTKSWTIEGTIKRGNTAGTTAIVGTVITNIIAANSGASSWTVAAAANTTLGCLQISVTGQAAVGIRWACEVQTVEATF